MQDKKIKDFTIFLKMKKEKQDKNEPWATLRKYLFIMFLIGFFILLIGDFFNG